MAWLYKSKARNPLAHGVNAVMAFSPWDRGRISKHESYYLDNFDISVRGESGHVYTLKLSRSEAERFARLLADNSRKIEAE